MQEEATIVGRLELVNFPELGLNQLPAKVDTGAYSGALHCTHIRVVRRASDGRRVLQFRPNGHKEEHETDKFITSSVRSALGHRQRRYLIKTEIELRGKRYPITIGLSDRSDMRKPVLLGRRFLKENNIIVDVRINAKHGGGESGL